MAIRKHAQNLKQNMWARTFGINQMVPDHYYDLWTIVFCALQICVELTTVLSVLVQQYRAKGAALSTQVCLS